MWNPINEMQGEKTLRASWKSFTAGKGEPQSLTLRIMFAQVQRENYSQGITSLINSNKEHAFFKNKWTTHPQIKQSPRECLSLFFLWALLSEFDTCLSHPASVQRSADAEDSAKAGVGESLELWWQFESLNRPTSKSTYPGLPSMSENTLLDYSSQLEFISLLRTSHQHPSPLLYTSLAIILPKKEFTSRSFFCHFSAMLIPSPRKDFLLVCKPLSSLFSLAPFLRQFSVFPGIVVLPQLNRVLAVRRTCGCLLSNTLISWLCVTLVNVIISSLIYSFTNMYRTAVGQTLGHAQGIQGSKGKILTWRVARIFMANYGRGWALRGFKSRRSMACAPDWCYLRRSQEFLNYS